MCHARYRSVQNTHTRARAQKNRFIREDIILRLLTLYLSRIGSHRDWTIFRTTRALSREHCILNTLGVGHGISDKKQMSITYTHINNRQTNKKTPTIQYNYMDH